MTVIRNPFDVFVSWINLVGLCNHNSKAPFDYEKDYPEWWDWWVRDCATLMAKWFEVVMRDARLRKVPTIWVRYEDLCTEPEENLNNIMKFLIGVNDVTGTNAERRVKEVINLDKASTQTYTLKDTTLKFNAQSKRYNKEQWAFVQETLKPMLYFFGYAKDPHGGENNTGFFDYGPLDKQDPELVKSFKGYKSMNKNIIEWVASMNEEDLAGIRYKLSDKTKEVDLLPDPEMVYKSVNDHHERKLYGNAMSPCK